MKRLIEGDLPIGRISAHASREKSIRHGHLSTLHIWWARRPLAACRAVILGALLPDPTDPACPPAFRDAARAALLRFAGEIGEVAAGGSPELVEALGAEAQKWIAVWNQATAAGRKSDLSPWKTPEEVRQALLDFIGDAAAWEMSTEPAMLECARSLVKAAYPDEKPLVLDPFAGGGAIPLEALRVGADAFALDLNPVAVLLLKMVLEEIPKHGERLVEEVGKWGAWVKAEAEKDLARFYPKDKDGAVPIAYLWARTVKCDEAHGGCGAEIPLIRQPWLARKGARSIALKMIPNKRTKRVDFEIVHGVKEKDIQPGTVRRGNAACPVCHHTTPVTSVRKQLKARRGGARDARMLAVVTVHPAAPGRRYRLPRPADREVAAEAEAELKRRINAHKGALSLVPDEPLPPGTAHRAVGSQLPLYGFETWGDLFTPRQALALVTFVEKIREVQKRVQAATGDDGVARAVRTLLALVLDKTADLGNSLATWKNDAECPVHMFGRQVIPMVWDFAESAPIGEASGSWTSQLERTIDGMRSLDGITSSGRAGQGTAARVTALPDEQCHAVVTDPPYYDAIPYSDLSDFFYVWQKRCIGELYPDLFRAKLTPKAEELVVHHAHVVDGERGTKDRASFEAGMTQAMAEARRVLRSDGIGVVVFAHKSTSGWEAMLKAMIDAGWTVTASWPIDTEMGARLIAMGTAALASSVHLVCRPRAPKAGVGEWRQVLGELQPRIREWMGRLVKEGIVGADAIFACIGPALEIYSRYEKVETAAGKVVSLREYLEEVWKVVGREALATITTAAGVDTTGFEEDARLTALWLWTVYGGRAEVGRAQGPPVRGEETDGGGEEGTASKKGARGLALEYDAARKLAQGIGAHLEDLAGPGGVVEVDGETAYLVAVRERRERLMGETKGGLKAAPTREGKAGGEDAAPTRQGILPGAIAETVKTLASEAEAEKIAEGAETVLDRVHQAMLLFADNRSEPLKQFLTEGGQEAAPANDQRFRAVGQMLSTLYPPASEEKRWVDGMLARMKTLGM